MSDFRAPVPLVLLAQSGDLRALDQLLRGIQEPLFDYLAGLVGDRHLAEDILQEVFVLLWRKLRWLRDPRLFRSWSYRIASREAFRRLRTHRWRSRIWDDTDLDTVVEPAPPQRVPTGLVEQIPAMLDSVSPASRAVLILHYLQGLTLDEVAEALDLPTGTVKSRLAYGLAALRRTLDPSQETS